MKGWTIKRWLIPSSIAHKWANLTITAKFNVAFGGLFSLLLLVSGASYLFLDIVRRQTEAAIFTSTEIQRRILEMDATLQAARVHERDFFLRYSQIGFAEAQTEYASKAVTNIAEVIRLSKELEQLISASNVSDALRDQNIDLTRYFFFAERYQNTFLDAVDLATKLAGEDIGLWGEIDNITYEIRGQFEQANNSKLMSLYYRMRSFEKDYRITHEKKSIQIALNIAFEIHTLTDADTSINTQLKSKIHALLFQYEEAFRDIQSLEDSIQEKFRDFDLQALQVDPVSTELIRLSREEVARAQTQILYTSWLASTSLGTMVIVGLLLASLIARVLNNSITQRVVLLNQAVKRLESGNLEMRTNLEQWVDHPDELGQLGRSFNQMAHQLQTTFDQLESTNDQLESTNDQLEQRVRDRTVELSDAIKQLQSAQAQLVQTEKMSSLGQMVAGVAHEINNPVSFIYGNISPAYEYVDELTELIHLYQMHYPNPHPIIQEQIEAIDLEFLQQDLWQLLDSMQEGANRIREIVKSLRTFSRIDEAEFKTVDLHSGLDSTFMLLRNRFKYSNQKGEIEIIKRYGELPLISCYPGQLNQVFMNIISNAIDAIEMSSNPENTANHIDIDRISLDDLSEEEISPNPSKLDISKLDVSKLDVSNLDISDEHSSLDSRLASLSGDRIEIHTKLIDVDWVLIKVMDNGPGMTEAVREKLFDPFFTTKPVGKGTGLGLSVSYQIIVERHKGKLWCESVVGEGTTFNIQIPICQSH